MQEKDLKQIKKLFKEGLEPFATKDDLKELPSRDDLKAFATKDDLKELPSKDDVKKAVSQGLAEFWEGNMEPAFDSLHQRIDIVETKLDRALYTEIVHLEARVSRLEEKTGVKRK